MTKQLQYLSIQGSNAPTYWFKNYDAQNFRALVESITINSSLFVSSIYRSDLFYYAEDDETTDHILRAWCAYKRISFSESRKQKFVRGLNKHEAFEYYFDTIFRLMHQLPHLIRYKERLNELIELEPNNSILKELMECDSHLTEKYKEEEVDYISLSTPSGLKPSFLPVKNFKLIADKGISELICN
ncbi:MAG: hypothetical protein RJQ14_22935 [Marinoscillum sp.]